MKKLLKLMLAQNILRAPEGADGADGGGQSSAIQRKLCEELDVRGIL